MRVVHEVREKRRVPLREFGIYALAGCGFGVITFPRTTEVIKALEEHR